MVDVTFFSIRLNLNYQLIICSCLKQFSNIYYLIYESQELDVRINAFDA